MTGGPADPPVTGGRGGRPVVGERELADVDVAAALEEAARTGGTPPGLVTVAAALAADRLSVRPRSVTFLAEVVRRGGTGYAAALPEPLPGPRRAALASSWLAAVQRGRDPRAHPDLDARVARWLDNVALVLAARHQAR